MKTERGYWIHRQVGKRYDPVAGAKPEESSCYQARVVVPGGFADDLPVGTERVYSIRVTRIDARPLEQRN